jgi:hypothetical protein
MDRVSSLIEKRLSRKFGLSKYATTILRFFAKKWKSQIRVTSVSDYKYLPAKKTMYKINYFYVCSKNSSDLFLVFSALMPKRKTASGPKYDLFDGLAGRFFFFFKIKQLFRAGLPDGIF